MYERFTYKKSCLVAIAVLLLNGLSVVEPANAVTPINRATVRSLRNVVNLILRERGTRPAKVKDSMTPGDAVETARASMVELQFNDQSLARIGERALFQFLPNTRTFRLTNGTAFLLIPPGQGGTQVRTPNAAVGIRGSALFVRYIPETEITIVGALTNSGIEISNHDQSQRQPIAAGQMAVIVKDRIERVYNFDLKTFYETSSLVKDLDLQSRKSLTEEQDPLIAAVREETLEAVENQPVVTDQTTAVIENPDFLRRPTSGQSDASGLPPGTLPGASLGTSGVDRSTLLIGIDALSNPALSFPNSPIRTVPLPGVANGRPGEDSSGQPGNAFGLAVTNPGRNNGGPPGLTGSAPGLSVTNPGRNNGGPPGLTNSAPGLSVTNPGRGTGIAPGQSVIAPGQSVTNLGRGTGIAPGQSGSAPGQSILNPGRGTVIPPGQLD